MRCILIQCTATIMTLVVCGGCAKQESPREGLSPLVVDDVDFALDNGSILFMLSEPSGTNKTNILCVHPQSEVLDIFFSGRRSRGCSSTRYVPLTGS